MKTTCLLALLAALFCGNSTLASTVPASSTVISETVTFSSTSADSAANPATLSITTSTATDSASGAPPTTKPASNPSTSSSSLTVALGSSAPSPTPQTPVNPQSTIKKCEIVGSSSPAQTQIEPQSSTKKLQIVTDSRMGLSISTSTTESQQKKLSKAESAGRKPDTDNFDPWKGVYTTLQSLDKSTESSKLEQTSFGHRNLSSTPKTKSLAHFPIAPRTNSSNKDTDSQALSYSMSDSSSEQVKYLGNLTQSTRSRGKKKEKGGVVTKPTQTIVVELQNVVDLAHIERTLNLSGVTLKIVEQETDDKEPEIKQEYLEIKDSKDEIEIEEEIKIQADSKDQNKANESKDQKDSNDIEVSIGLQEKNESNDKELKEIELQRTQVSKDKKKGLTPTKLSSWVEDDDIDEKIELQRTQVRKDKKKGLTPTKLSSPWVKDDDIDEKIELQRTQVRKDKKKGLIPTKLSSPWVEHDYIDDLPVIAKKTRKAKKAKFESDDESDDSSSSDSSSSSLQEEKKVNHKAVKIYFVSKDDINTKNPVKLSNRKQ